MDLPRAAPARYPAPLPPPGRASEYLKHPHALGSIFMGRLEHVGSYYAASAHDAPRRPALAEGVDCDVCVVGARIPGCPTALQRALPALRVVLLDEQRVGWGAPGR